MPFQQKYTFPVRDSNAFDLLVDGEQYFSAMLSSIKVAKQHIFLEQYLVATSKIGKQFVQALTAAVQRGVNVYCIFDDYGSRDFNKYSRQQLINAGIHLCFYNPIKLKHWQSALFRDHRKLLLIDNEIGFVGGAGITDSFLSSDSENSWHDVILKIQGAVLDDWSHLFLTTWKQISEIDITFTEAPKPSEYKQSGQVLVNHPWHQEFNRMMLNKMRQSSNYIWICSPYFLPSWKLRRRLKRMANYGIDVRLLLSGDRSDHRWVTQAARRHYKKLLKNKIRIFEYQPRFTHAKIILCDHWLSIGSSNLDRWNQRWNLDANQAVEYKPLAEKTRDLFLNDFEQSKEIKLSEWLQRPWWQRWHEAYAGYLVLFLEVLSRYLPKRRKY